MDGLVQLPVRRTSPQSHFCKTHYRYCSACSQSDASRPTQPRALGHRQIRPHEAWLCNCYNELRLLYGSCPTGKQCRFSYHLEFAKDG